MKEGSLVDSDELEAADVPVADHRRVGRVHPGNHAALEPVGDVLNNVLLYTQYVL